jgi:hypothetical protein
VVEECGDGVAERDTIGSEFGLFADGDVGVKDVGKMEGRVGGEVGVVDVFLEEAGSVGFVTSHVRDTGS